MGIFNDASSGYKKAKNTLGLTNKQMLERLTGVGISCGEPYLGTIRGFHGPEEAIIFECGMFDLYVKCTQKKIDVVKIYSDRRNDGNKGLEASKRLAQGLFFQGVAYGNSNQADRCVDEIFACFTGVYYLCGKEQNWTYKEEIKSHPC